MSRRQRTKRGASAEVEAHVETLLAKVRAELKERPGVYRMLSPDGEILYVGKAKSLKNRLCCKH